MRLLIVDDDPQMVRMLVSLLALYGAQDCLTASSSKEAALILGRESVDGVVLDLMMPGIDGVQFMRALRETPDKHSLPVLVVSADNSAESVRATAAMGAFDFVLKPLRPVVVGERLQRFVAHCRGLSQRS